MAVTLEVARASRNDAALVVPAIGIVPAGELTAAEYFERLPQPKMTLEEALRFWQGGHMQCREGSPFADAIATVAKAAQQVQQVREEAERQKVTLDKVRQLLQGES